MHKKVLCWFPGTDCPIFLNIKNGLIAILKKLQYFYSMLFTFVQPNNIF